MEIPVSFAYSGDEALARQLTKLGMYKMGETEQFMRFQGLAQHKHVYDIAPGVVVITQKVFGIRQVFIHVDPRGGVEEQGERICLCNCNFAFGIIIEEQEDRISGVPLYSVLACREKKFYAIERDVLASDWTVYLPGQKVVLIPYNEMHYTCCTETPLATGCRPIKSEELIETDKWRTTMRILPWRAFTLQKWLVVHG